MNRWNKIAKEAAEQSHRQSTPLVRAPLTFKNLIELGQQYDRKIVAYEEEAKGGEKSQFAKILNASAAWRSFIACIWTRRRTYRIKKQRNWYPMALLCAVLDQEF